MIDCRQANNLFDVYLDGELGGSLTTELHAHVLACDDCRLELALHKAGGDVVAADRAASTECGLYRSRHRRVEAAASPGAGAPAHRSAVGGPRDGRRRGIGVGRPDTEQFLAGTDLRRQRSD